MEGFKYSPSFTLFPSLPTELRLKIWRSTFQPRIIELRLKYRHPPPNNLEALHFSTYCALPISLRISQESRYETLHHYHLSFESKDYYPNTSPQIYVNFSLDTIYLESQTFDILSRSYQDIGHKHPLIRLLTSTTKNNSNKIQSLAIDEKIWLANPSFDIATNLPSERESILAENAKAIRKFEGLKELIIVHHGVNISVPCAYSYLKTYELHKLYIADRENLVTSRVLNNNLSFYHPVSVYGSLMNLYNNPVTSDRIFIRYLDKPSWTPQKRNYPPVLRGEGMGIRNCIEEKDWDERYNEVGVVPIRGWELEELERGELGFFELGEGDFMDGLRRGCVEEDRKALEREAAEGETGWRVPVVRSVGLMRGGEEC